MQFGLILTGFVIIFILWTVLEQKQLVTTKYTAASTKITQAFHNTSFVVLADLHNYNFGKNNERLVKRIEELSPEFIIIAGDMINKRAACYPSNAFTLLEQLAKKYKIYYAYGNHEQRLERLLAEGSAQDCVSSTWVEYVERLRKMGVIFLDNESAVYSKNMEKLHITGVSIGKEFFSRSKTPVMEDSI
jgi:predicted MPP superfamily phosphohydrolase